jgi:hypothetical protein
MNGSCKFLVWCVLSLFAATGAHATDLASSVGAVCDSQVQAERLINLAGENENPRTALNQVNDEVGQKDACVIAPVYYVPGSKVARITNGLGTFEVVEVLVLAVETARGTAVFSTPVVWFAIFEADDKDV